MSSPGRSPRPTNKPGSRTPLGLTIALIVIAVLAIGLFAGSRGSKGDSAVDAAGPGTVNQAPDVALPATTGQTVDLAAFRGKRNVLLYFYEHAG